MAAAFHELRPHFAARSLRALMQGSLPVTAALVLDPLMARMVEDAGFGARSAKAD